MPFFPRRRKSGNGKPVFPAIKTSVRPLSPREQYALDARRARWKRIGKRAGIVAGVAGILGLGWLALRPRPPEKPPINPPNPNEGPQIPGNGRRQPGDVDPNTPKRNGRQPINPGTTEPGPKPKTRAQVLEERFNEIKNQRPRDRQYPFISRKMSYEAVKKVIERVLEKDFQSQRYDFSNPIWRSGQGKADVALEKAPIGSIIQLSRMNPETQKWESTFMVKTGEDFYYYSFLNSKGAIRGDSGNWGVMEYVEKSTGSQIMGIYAPNP